MLSRLGKPDILTVFSDPRDAICWSGFHPVNEEIKISLTGKPTYWENVVLPEFMFEI